MTAREFALMILALPEDEQALPLVSEGGGLYSEVTPHSLRKGHDSGFMLGWYQAEGHRYTMDPCLFL